jgi:catechol 2,3-dioxygenase-like lactoylglutathione lyase family enzyme
VTESTSADPKCGCKYRPRARLCSLSFDLSGSGRTRIGVTNTLGLVPRRNADAELHMVGLIVTDMRRALDFYRLVGVAAPRPATNSHVQFKAQRDVTLFLDDDPVAWDPTFREGPYRHLIEFYLRSESAVRATAEKLSASGHRLTRRPYITQYGMCFAMAEDPDGNPILLSGDAE